MSNTHFASPAILDEMGLYLNCICDDSLTLTLTQPLYHACGQVKQQAGYFAEATVLAQQSNEIVKMQLFMKFNVLILSTATNEHAAHNRCSRKSRTSSGSRDKQKGSFSCTGAWIWLPTDQHFAHNYCACKPRLL